MNRHHDLLHQSANQRDRQCKQYGCRHKNLRQCCQNILPEFVQRMAYTKYSSIIQKHRIIQGFLANRCRIARRFPRSALSRFYNFRSFIMIFNFFILFHTTVKNNFAIFINQCNSCFRIMQAHTFQIIGIVFIHSLCQTDCLMNQLLFHRLIQFASKKNTLQQCCHRNSQNGQQTHALKNSFFHLSSPIR